MQDRQLDEILHKIRFADTAAEQRTILRKELFKQDLEKNTEPQRIVSETIRNSAGSQIMDDIQVAYLVAAQTTSGAYDNRVLVAKVSQVLDAITQTRKKESQ